MPKFIPIYPDVYYVDWDEHTIEFSDGNSFTIEFISFGLGPYPIQFEFADFIEDTWKTKYPTLDFVSFDRAGFDPNTFLTEND